LKCVWFVDGVQICMVSCLLISNWRIFNSLSHICGSNWSKKKTPNINQNREIALKMFAFMFVCVYLKQRSSFFLNKRCCCCYYVLYISLELFVKFICNLEFLNFVPRIEFWFFNVLFFYISLNLRCVLKKKLTKKDWNQNQIENFGFRPISVCFFWAAQQNFVNYFAF